MKILVIEDEYNLADVISSMLKSNNYMVDIDTDGEDGLYNALSDLYDLIILDVMLPHKNGFEILSEIRKNNIKAKVIMLTAKSDIESKMIGFNNGADDYLTKPFHMDELIARVNIQLRKGSSIEQNTISAGDLLLNISQMTLENINNSNTINVIGKEFQLLEILMNNSNQVIEKNQLFNKIWGYESESDINTLEAYISFLRKKINILDSNVKIKVVRGIGYKLEVNNEEVKD
jgi:DNA-binding response OmpR family regulator